MTNHSYHAFELLLKNIGGEGNNRFQTILVAAIISTPVRITLNEAINFYSAHFDDAKQQALPPPSPDGPER